MARTIRQIGLRLLRAAIRLVQRRSTAGWRLSTRGTSLDGR